MGYCVVAALQDPRKEVMSIRNLFPDRIAMRLDEPEQVDMVLGDGARDRGAAADLISTNPAIGAGVASSGWNPTPTRSASAPPGSPTPTSAPWPRPAPPCDGRRCWRSRQVPPHERDTTWRTDDPCPACGTGLMHRHRRAPVTAGLPAVRLVRHLDRPGREAAMTGPHPAERLATPLARDALRQVTEDRGGCIRPVQLRRTDLDTGQVDRSWSPAAPPWKRSARPAPDGPRPCAPRSAAKAGTSRPNPT